MTAKKKPAPKRLTDPKFTRVGETPEQAEARLAKRRAKLEHEASTQFCLFKDGTQPTTENILVKLMLAREGVRPSALQRAVCRAMDGISFVLEEDAECVGLDCKIITYPAGFDLWDLPEVQAAFGHGRPPETQPAMFAHISAIRGAKSMTAAAKAIQMVQTVDFSHLGPGDLPMLAILAPNKDAAEQTWNHVFGALNQSDELRALISRKPRGRSAWIYHPSGRDAEVVVRALSAMGTGLTTRWLVGAIWDEGPRMVGAKEGQKNLDESLTAAEGRVLEGGQLLIIGSPARPYGPVYDMYTEHFGKPTEDKVICKARGDFLNPVKWTPKEQAKLLRRNPDAHRTDFLAEFSDPQDAFIPSNAIERNRRLDPEELPFDPSCSYVAAMDPSGRANAYTFIVLARKPSTDLRARYTVACAKQWRLPAHRQKGEFLNTGAILAEIKDKLNSYGLYEVHTDQYAPEVFVTLGDMLGIDVIPHDFDEHMRREGAQAIRVGLEEDRLELAPDHYLREDLVRLQKRITSNGVGVHMPNVGGRHCDFFPALTLCVLHPPGAPGEVRAVNEEQQMIGQVLRRMQGQDVASEAARALWS